MRDDSIQLSGLRTTNRTLPDALMNFATNAVPRCKHSGIWKKKRHDFAAVQLRVLGGTAYRMAGGICGGLKLNPSRSHQALHSIFLALSSKAFRPLWSSQQKVDSESVVIDE